MTIDWAIVSPIVVGLITGIAGYLAMQVQHKGKPENALIDQMQEQQKAADKRLAQLEVRLHGFEARDQVYIPHIIRLNMHIEQGLGPPAPKIPKVILDYLKDQEDEDAA